MWEKSDPAGAQRSANAFRRRCGDLIIAPSADSPGENHGACAAPLAAEGSKSKFCPRSRRRVKHRDRCNTASDVPFQQCASSASGEHSCSRPSTSVQTTAFLDCKRSTRFRTACTTSRKLYPARNLWGASDHRSCADRLTGGRGEARKRARREEDAARHEQA